MELISLELGSIRYKQNNQEELRPKLPSHGSLHRRIFLISCPIDLHFLENAFPDTCSDPKMQRRQLELLRTSRPRKRLHWEEPTQCCIGSSPSKSSDYTHYAPTVCRVL